MIDYHTDKLGSFINEKENQVPFVSELRILKSGKSGTGGKIATSTGIRSEHDEVDG